MGILKETPKQQVANDGLDKAKIRFVIKKKGDNYFWNLKGTNGHDQLPLKDWSVEQLQAMINYIEAFPESETIKNRDKKPPK
jgi:hypothetical protein